MKTRKLFALTISLIMGMTSLTGCGMGGFQKEKNGATLELSMDNSWKSTPALQSVSHDPHFSVGAHVLCSKVMPYTGEREYCWIDPITKENTRFLPKCAENLEQLERLDSSPIKFHDGTFGIICLIYKGLGGGEIEIHRRCMEVYDEDLTLIETVELPDEMFDMVYADASKICTDKDGNWYVVQPDPEQNYKEVVHCYQFKDGKFLEYGVAETEDEYFRYMFTTADGTVHIVYHNFDHDDNYYDKVYKLDAVNHSAERVYLAVGGEAYQYAAGMNGYDFFYVNSNGLYGVKGSEQIQLVNWINSDFMPYHVQSFIPMEDGNFIVGDGNDGFSYITPRSQEEIDNTKLISMAAVDLSGSLLEAVMDYNREDNGYRFVVKDYGEYSTTEEPYKGYEVMKDDMLNGIVADLICTDGVNFESLASKGLFADWYTLMDADEEFHREDYYENFFEAYEYRGKLCRLGINFTVMTNTAKTEFVGEEQGQSLAQQLDIPLQDGMQRFVCQPAEQLVEPWMRRYQTGIINRDTAECYFDSPDFVKLLEELNSIPQGDAFYSSEGEVWITDEGGNFMPQEYGINWRENRVLYNDMTLSEPMNIRTLRRMYFGDEDITLTGYPMVIDEGNGGVFNTEFTVSINAQSKEQEAIWDMIKYLLSEDYQRKMRFTLPVNRAAMEKKIDIDEHNVTFAAFGEVFIGELESWESDIFRDYIEGIRTCYYYDYKVHDILMEEAEKMLAGDQSPQECADMMQSRVSIYLSEQS